MNSNIALTSIFLKGFLIGLSIAAPVGPISILCIRRSLMDRLAIGLAVGLGAATGDGIYGLVAAFGITSISSFLINHTLLLRCIGGIFLTYLGIVILLKKPSHNAAYVPSQNVLYTYISTVLLTLTNPLTILSFAAIFAGVDFAETTNNYQAATLLTLGVFLGSAVWFIALSTLVNLFKKQCNEQVITWINRISGIFLIGFGIIILATIFAL